MGFEYKSTEIIGKNLEKVSADLAETAEQIESLESGKASKKEVIKPTSIIPPITTDFVSTGTTWNQVTKKISGELTTNTVPTLEIPNLVYKDFQNIGFDKSTGCVIAKRDSSYFEVHNGGETLVSISPNVAISSLWTDGEGNRFGRSGSSVYRAEKGTWNFSLAFTFSDSGYASRFCFAENGSEVIFTSYADPSGSNGRGTEVFTSVDGGLNFTRTVIDYGQVHLHTAYIHKPTGVWYIVVGEVVAGNTEQWRGILKSTDKGATWTQIQVNDGTYSTGIQPIFAVEIDDEHILWSTDTVPSGFLLHNVTTDSIERIPVAAQVGAGPDYTGFAYSMAVDEQNNTIVVPFDKSASDGVTNFIIMDRSVDGVKNPVAVMSSAIESIKAKKWIDGVDKYGYFYAWDANETGCYAWESTEIINRRTIQTANPNTFVGNANWANSPAVTGETYEGLPVLAIGGDNKNLNPDEPFFSVSGGEELYVTAMVKRGEHDDTNNFYLQVNWRLDGSFVSMENITLFLKNIPKDGNFHKIRFKVIVPSSGVNEIVPKWLNNTTNINYAVGSITITKDFTNEPLWMPNGLFSQNSRISLELTNNTFIRNRIYQLAKTSQWGENTEFSLMTLGNLEIGMSKPTGATEHESYVYIDDGTTREEILVSQYGGGINVKERTFYKQGTNLHSTTFIPAPVIVGVSSKQVLVVNPNTSDIHTIDLQNNIIGSEVELTGNAHHVFDYFEAVLPSDRDYLLKKA